MAGGVTTGADRMPTAVESHPMADARADAAARPARESGMAGGGRGIQREMGMARRSRGYAGTASVRLFSFDVRLYHVQTRVHSATFGLVTASRRRLDPRTGLDARLWLTALSKASATTSHNPHRSYFIDFHFDD